jgi:sulfate permease, SulP family
MRSLTLKKIKDNLLPGITVGLASIPISISLAVASNATPLAGTITAVWAGIFAAMFGGSHFNITGPTGALAGLLVVYSTQYGVSCMPMIAILSGIITFLAYAIRVERYLVFIPGSALHGSILGVAGMIILGQIVPAFGLTTPAVHHHSLLVVGYQALLDISTIQWPTFALFFMMLSILLLCARYTPRLPGSIIVAPLGIVIGYLANQGSISYSFLTLGSKFIITNASLIDLPFFHFRFSYLIPAFYIAALSILETMISARIADGVTKTKHNKRKELIGLGLGNIASGIAGGIPATAALARTALNIRSGATHKISGVIGSVCVAVLSVFFLSYFSYLPLAVVAAILVFVAFRMVEMEHFWHLYRADKKNFTLSLVVAFVTVYEDPAVGILLGAVIAMLLFMEKLSTGYHDLAPVIAPPLHLNKLSPATAANTMVYTIKGPLAYINAQAHVSRVKTIEKQYSIIILNIHDVHFIDFDGTEAVDEIINLLLDQKRTVLIAGASPLIEHFLHKTPAYKDLEQKQCVFNNVSDALIFANQTNNQNNT